MPYLREVEDLALGDCSACDRLRGRAALMLVEGNSHALVYYCENCGGYWTEMDQAFVRIPALDAMSKAGAL